VEQKKTAEGKKAKTKKGGKKPVFTKNFTALKKIES